MEKIVEIINLNYKDIFKKLYLDVDINDFLMVIGKNKCGKTTLANIIVGNIGTIDNVLIDGELINYYDKKNITLLSESIYQNQHVIVKTVIKDQEKAKKIFKTFSSVNLLSKYFDELSDGELEIVNILLTIMEEPKILVIDDALSKINTYLKNKILSYLNKMCKNKQITLIYFTSDMEDLVYAKSIAVIDDKRIIVNEDINKILKEEQLFTNINQTLPFMANLCTKLKYYDLVDKIILDKTKLVNKLWK